jgi:copper oxidase (laccase) domain-containing protein
MSNVRIATSTITDGNMSYRWGVESEVNIARDTFLAVNNFPSQYVEMSVEHSNRIVDVSEQTDFPIKPSCDALVTKTNIPLFLLTADCFPVVIHDPVNQVVALLHLGWKSTSLRLPEKCLSYLIQNYNSDPTKLLVHIGPGISKDSYLTLDPTQKNDQRWTPFLFDDENGTHVDVSGYILNQLIESGVFIENVHFKNIDTFTSDKYFSHYRSKTTGEPEGRFVTVVKQSFF